MIEKPLPPAQLLRLAAAVLPLSMILAAPLRAEDVRGIPVCSGGEARLIYLPAGDNGSPVPRKERESGCAHFTCPRDRNGGEPAEEDEE